MRKKEMSLESAKRIWNWYEQTGKKNWGVWSNHPINGRYHSFDNCHLRIMLNEIYRLDGEEFDCIIDDGCPVGKNNGVVTVFSIRHFLEKNGVKFIENLTSDLHLQEKEKEKEKLLQIIKEFEDKHTNFCYQKNECKKRIDLAIKYLCIAKKQGEQISKQVEHDLVLSNYCGKLKRNMNVKAVLNGLNARKTVGYYEVIEFKIEEYEKIIEDFAEEQVEINNQALNFHKKQLNLLLS